MPDDLIVPPSELPVPVDLKAGLKSTEFYLTVLGQLAALVTQYQGVIPPPWGVVAAVALGALYTIARTLLKRETIKATGP